MTEREQLAFPRSAPEKMPEPVQALSDFGETILRGWVNVFKEQGNDPLARMIEEALSELHRLRSERKRFLTVAREGEKSLQHYCVGTSHPSLVMLHRSLRAVAREGER